MNDEKVERVAEAMFRATNMNEPATWDEEGESYYTHLARAAIAALRDEPPLESLLEPYEPVEVVLVPTYDGEIGARGVIASWEVIIRESGAIRVHVGHGDTIRAAVANAEGENSG